MSKASKHAHTQPFMRASELAELGAFYGTTKQRLGKDSQRAWNLCNLTLTEIKDDEAAVVTPEGVLYSREALLQSMIAQKKKYKVALAAYKEYQERVKSEEQRKEREKALEEQRAFEKESVAKKQKTAVKPDYFRAERAGVEAAGPVKPRKGAFCPVTGSKLKLAQLHDVHMSKSCRSCKRDFTNGSVVSLLAPSGMLVCESCCASTNPVTGEPCSVIRLRRGGTGFSSNNDETLLATKKREGFQLG